MRFEFDREKSRDLKRKHGASLKEAQDIFDQVYLVGITMIRNNFVPLVGAAVDFVP